jgi:RNA polymerase II subunit A C-terminal domain phosphatase
VSSYNNDANDADRAPFQTSHDTQMLRISQREASRREEEAKRRLLASRRLSLVVDLDQTIIHAAVDPTIAEWQKDKENPNYEAVKDVRSFQLIDDGPGMRGCWYYIKLRPGLQEFLEQVSQIYELHIYTMGTRQYAEQIANIVDPNRSYFGDRILSRDESGSMTHKTLERLFPIDTKMVVIIDDRGDVWKWNANLVRVVPFDFFVGIGDINSSFLPKKLEIKATTKIEKSEDAKPEQASTDDQSKSKSEENIQDGAERGVLASTNGTDASTLDQLVAMSGGDDPVIREIQSKGQEETIAAQLEEKPLLQMQKLLDAKDQAAAAAAAEDTTTTHTVLNGDIQESNVEPESSSSSEAAEPAPTPAPKPTPTRHSLLRDDDRELASLSTRLKAVHTAFYAEYDRQRLGQKGGRVAALSGKGRKMQLQTDSFTSTEDASDLLLVPDIKSVMPTMKNRVLSGVVIVFSGVLPLETDVQTADISLWAKTFGAVIAMRVSRKVTHVVAARAGTSKVKQGVRRGLWVVSTQWLVDCMTGWKRLKEDGYVLEDLRGGKRTDTKDGSPESSVGADDRKELLDENRGFLLSSDEGDGETTGLDTEAETEDNRKAVKDGTASEAGRDRKRLKLNTKNLADDDAMTTDNDDTINGFMEDASPLSINQDEWADMDKELREFIGSEVDSESDAESESSRLSIRNTNKRKRPDDGEESDNDGRRRVVSGSATGSSSLKDLNTTSSITNANSADTNNPVGNDTPNNFDDDEDAEIRREQKVVESAELQEQADELSSDDELARELEREFEDSSGDDEEGFMDPTKPFRADDVELGTVHRPTGDDEDEVINRRDTARGGEV